MEEKKINNRVLLNIALNAATALSAFGLALYKEDAIWTIPGALCVMAGWLNAGNLYKK